MILMTFKALILAQLIYNFLCPVETLCTKCCTPNMVDVHVKGKFQTFSSKMYCAYTLYCQKGKINISQDQLFSYSF